MNYPMLHGVAKFFMVLGWAQPVLGLVAGFAPWAMFMGQPIPIMFAWEKWLIYASPIIGLIGGAITGLGYIIVAQVILMLLDYGDTLDGILDGIRRLVRLHEPQGGAAKRDVRPADEIEAVYQDKRL